jgi:sirohydrochlorin cobaltochelatase
MKCGILLVVFGTRVVEARAVFDRIGRCVGDRFMGWEVRWAYSSASVRRALMATGDGVESPLEAMERMYEDGFTHLAVQSLHIVAGAEYHALARVVAAFRDGEKRFEGIALGKPLLVRRGDLERAVESVLAAVPMRERGDAVVLMGHGSARGRCDMTYLATAAAFRQHDPLAFFGTLEGQPTLDNVREQLRVAGVSRAYLVPFLSVVGRHVCHDLAGDGPESWMSVLSRDGVTCIPVLRGLAECDGVVEIWLDHLSDALGELK